MKADEEHLLIFEGASAVRYPQRYRPSEQRGKNDKWFQPSGLQRDNRPGAALAWRFACPAVASQPLRQPAAGMLVSSRLARGPWLARPLLRIRYGFQQRPLCDLISVSLTGPNPQTSRFRTFRALSSMKILRGSTTSPMRMSNMRPASRELSSLSSTLRKRRRSGFMAVS